MLRGRTVVDFIKTQLHLSDYGASSHWRYMLETYCGEPAGLRGFSGHTPIKSPLHRIAHTVLQQPILRYARAYPSGRELIAIARTLCRDRQGQFDLAMIRQALSLAFIDQYRCLQDLRSVLVIGDGFAAMSALLLRAAPQCKVVLVNLDKILLVDAEFLLRTIPASAIALPTNEAEMSIALLNEEVRAVFLRASDYELIAHTKAQLAISISAMQEMDLDVIANYFTALRAIEGGVTFYCLSRVNKRLPDGTEVRFAAFPWSPLDSVLADEIVPWHHFYYMTRPPFFARYDGPAQHRLARLAPGPLELVDATNG